MRFEARFLGLTFLVGLPTLLLTVILAWTGEHMRADQVHDKLPPFQLFPT